MSILKLAVGTPITLAVKAVRQVDGNFGPQLAFDNEAGETLFVGLETATKQLERIGYTQQTVVGKRLHFEKVQKNSKTYTNINPAPGGGNGGAGTASAAAPGGDSNTPPAPSASTAQPADPHDQKATALYLTATKFVLSQIQPLYEAAGITMTDRGVSACVNTLFINARNGH